MMPLDTPSASAPVSEFADLAAACIHTRSTMAHELHSWLTVPDTCHFHTGCNAPRSEIHLCSQVTKSRSAEARFRLQVPGPVNDHVSHATAGTSSLQLDKLLITCLLSLLHAVWYPCLTAACLASSSLAATFCLFFCTFLSLKKSSRSNSSSSPYRCCSQEI